MKVAVNRIALISALKTVRAARFKRSALPILQMVLLAAADGCLQLTCTDLTAVITTKVKAKIVAKGDSCCVSPDKVLLLLDTLKTPSVTLLSKDKMMEISSGTALCITDIMPGKEFPDFKDKLIMKKAKPIIISALVPAVNKVAYAMATEDTRPVLSGMSLKFLDGEIELCAADGFRMATTRVKYTTAHKFKKGDPRQYIIPGEAIRLFKAFERDKIVMCIGDNYLTFSTPDIVIGTGPIQGTYPDYKQIYPDPKNLKPMTFDRGEMLDALKAVIKQKEFKLHPLRLETKRGGGVKVWSQDGDGHKLEFMVQGKGSGKIAFNASLLRDTVSLSPAPSIKMMTTSDKGPAMVKYGHDVHLLMPMYVV
ncbi:MAG: DNA polymerase III subunit beta [Candidatus Omnitrophica bacterium]|nr:DNA polymerase III subunit beta [Candidatus Omnitrophota bacterium]